jgi:hypothetical protein
VSVMLEAIEGGGWRGEAAGALPRSWVAGGVASGAGGAISGRGVKEKMTDESDSKAAVRPDGHIGTTGVVRLCD